MRSISVLLVLSLLMGMAAVTATAQRTPPAPPPAQSAFDRMIPPDLQRQLNLTADQRKRLIAIADRSDAQMRKVFSDAKTPREKKAEQLSAMMQKTEKEIDAVLTQKQREIRRKYQADMMRKQMQNMPKPTPEMMREIVMMGPDMVKKLGVTPDQLKRIDPIAQRAYKEFEKMMMNSGNNLDQQAMMKRLEGLADKAIADVRKVLNPRQQKMYDEVVAQRRKQFADAQRRMQSPR